MSTKLDLTQTISITSLDWRGVHLCFSKPIPATMAELADGGWRATLPTLDIVLTATTCEQLWCDLNEELAKLFPADS